MASDPVCGMTVGEAGVHAQHNGTTYYFCSETCQKAFMDNPTRYLGGGTAAMPGARPATRAGTDQGYTLEAAQPPRAGIRPVTNAILAFAIMLGIYFGLLTLVSGREFALDQFYTYWYFIVSLAAGFAVQIGLYTHLRAMARHSAASGRVVA
ncbi:MAG TPA: YHS domain-containing protein, partial [Burkholderiales bacterium]|nr:YHS domain-containing protein [Burkholderiales bacterium]